MKYNENSQAEIREGCPFCGCPKEEIEVFASKTLGLYGLDKGQWVISCPKCHISMTRNFTYEGDSALRAYNHLVESWNLREGKNQDTKKQESEYLRIKVGKWYREVETGKIIFVVSDNLEKFGELGDKYWDMLAIVFYGDGGVEFDLFKEKVNITLQPMEEISLEEVPELILASFPWLQYDEPQI